jgi:hypothetical protein
MSEFTTAQPFERRNHIDNQLHTSIPAGTKLKIEEIFPGMYEVTADKPITKDHDNSIMVGQNELDSMR